MAVVMTGDEISQFPEGQAIRLRDGTLMRSEDSPIVYVVSEGTKRPIVSESTFVQIGWDWNDVTVVSPETILVHPLGSAFELTQEVEFEVSDS